MVVDGVHGRTVTGMRFTYEEFDTMVEELLYREPISFDMLCRIAEKTLRPSVVTWCKTDAYLRGRGYEDDIMQEVHLRLMKTTVTHFLLREDKNGSFNNDPEGFENWLFRVAGNLRRDFTEKVRNRDFKTADMAAPELLEVAEPESGNSDAQIERLARAFSVVLSSDVSIYKVLTWLAQFVFMLNYDVTKIKSTEMIVETFENKTLCEMYDLLLNASKRIPWIVITEEQNVKIIAALQKKWRGEFSYGETRYKEFFMRQNGVVSGKKSISDWVNRMNGTARRELLPKATDENTGKKNSPQARETRGRCENEAFDC